MLLPYLKVIRRDSSVLRGVTGVYHLGAVPQVLVDDNVSVTFAEAIVASNFFDVLRARPAVGRLVPPGGRRGRRAICNGSCIQVLGSRISRGLGDHRARID